QSEEHLRILDLLQVRGTVAVVTKADLVDPDRVATVAADVEGRLTGTSLAGTPVLAVDSLSGRGIAEVRAALGRRLSARSAGSLVAHQPWLWVDRAFTITGAGLVVTGTLTSGTMKVGDTIT